MATKPQIIEQLAALGITTENGNQTHPPLTGNETSAQPTAILSEARACIAVGNAPEAQDPAPEAAPVEAAAPSKSKVKLARVLTPDGQLINTYSSADNADYLERAHRVAAKHKGTVEEA